MKWFETTIVALAGVLIARLWLDRLVILARLCASSIGLRGTGLGVKSSRVFCELIVAGSLSIVLYHWFIEPNPRIDLSTFGLTQFSLELRGRWLLVPLAVIAIFLLANVAQVVGDCRRLTTAQVYATSKWLRHPLFSSKNFYTKQRSPRAWLFSESVVLASRLMPIMADAVVGLIVSDSAADARELLNHTGSARSTTWREIRESKRFHDDLMASVGRNEVGNNRKVHETDPALFCVLRYMIDAALVVLIAIWWHAATPTVIAGRASLATLNLIESSWPYILVITSASAAMIAVHLCIRPVAEINPKRVFAVGILVMLSVSGLLFAPSADRSVQRLAVERYSKGPISDRNLLAALATSKCEPAKHSAHAIHGSHWTYVLRSEPLHRADGGSTCDSEIVSVFRGYELIAEWALPHGAWSFASYGSSTGNLVFGPYTYGDQPLLAYSQVSGRINWRWRCPGKRDINGTTLDARARNWGDNILSVSCVTANTANDESARMYNINIASGKAVS